MSRVLCGEGLSGCVNPSTSLILLCNCLRSHTFHHTCQLSQHLSTHTYHVLHLSDLLKPLHLIVCTTFSKPSTSHKRTHLSSPERTTFRTPKRRPHRSKTNINRLNPGRRSTLDPGIAQTLPATSPIRVLLPETLRIRIAD